MEIEEILKEVEPIALAMEPVGSRVTCNPPPMDTDIDYLVLVDAPQDRNMETGNDRR